MLPRGFGEPTAFEVVDQVSMVARRGSLKRTRGCGSNMGTRNGAVVNGTKD